VLSQVRYCPAQQDCEAEFDPPCQVAYDSVQFPTKGAQMLRAAGAVILGYVVMVVIVFATLTGSYLGMGSEKVFEPGTYEVTSTWLFVMIVFSLVAAIAGGWVCAAIAKSKGAVWALMVLVLILGGLNTIPVVMASKAPPAVRTGDVPNLEAMMNGKEPVWFALLLPFIGVAGVMIGGRSKRS
jgi:magnesium-transporting ATPase (P-type)